MLNQREYGTNINRVECRATSFVNNSFGIYCTNINRVECRDKGGNVRLC